ncbi:MAG: VWA domain-containing protein [Verrucomicrobiota bacterium JB023]|nr:VWA domain-containing protein [Verrucomicrobiota bacterium JB023]
MNNDLTEIAFILDSSGSMLALAQPAIDGFNSFLGDQLAAPGQARLSLALFNHDYSLPVASLPLEDVRELTPATYRPSGTTALLDAIGRTIDDLGKRLANMPENERPGHIVVAIFTDGLENSSTDYTLAQVQSLITHQTEKYNWEFLFLAANQDALATAARMGIPEKSASTIEFSHEGLASSTEAFSSSIRESRSMLSECGTVAREEKVALSEEYEASRKRR